MPTQHLLVIRFSSMGDVAMVVPVVCSLSRQYPNLRITVLSQPFAKPLFENLANNINFMAADVKKEYKGVKGLNCLYRRLIAKQFTAIADLHDVLRSQYLRIRFNMAGFKVAHINKHRAGKRRLVDTNNKQLVQQPTSFQNYADVFARLGYPINLDFKSIFPPTGGNLRLLPAELNSKRPFQQWIGIAPFAAHQGKVYPLSMMHKVIQTLISKHPSCRIFLFGSGNTEKQQINKLCQDFPVCVNVPSLLKGLNQELILMSHLDVMISMDSANMHLASLTATPVVSIWGATHPYAGFMGWNQKMQNAVQINLNCRPCSIFGNKSCMRGDYACLKNISPEMVIEHVENVLKTSK